MSQINSRGIFDRNIAKMKSIKPMLSFDVGKDVGEQRARMSEKLLELIKIPPKETSPVPSILKYMEMPDMALMIAPRHLVAVNGIYDHLQPFEAAKGGFEVVKAIYGAAGVPENCDMVVGSEGHRFYADEAWPVFDRHMLA